MSTNVTIISQSILQLRLGSKYLSIAFALPLCIMGVLGNIVNIVVFLSLGNYKQNASSLYVLCKSFFDLTALITGLGLRVLSHSFQIDFSVKSRLWCKIRGVILEVGVFNSFTCLCLQSMDVFLSSSSSVNLRQKSNVRTARYILIGVFICWICHQIPYVFFQDLVNIKGMSTCRTINIIYSRYRNYFVVVGIGNIIPITLMSVFGFLTYRHLHIPEEIPNSNADPCRRRRSVSLSHLTKQMTNMTLYQIVVVFLCQTPFVIMQIYSCATEGMTKSAWHRAQEQLVQMIVVTCSYGTFASSFYCYCAASKRFRKQVIDVLNVFRGNPKSRRLSRETNSHITPQPFTTQI